MTNERKLAALFRDQRIEARAVRRGLYRDYVRVICYRPDTDYQMRFDAAIIAANSAGLRAAWTRINYPTYEGATKTRRLDGAVGN